MLKNEIHESDIMKVWVYSENDELSSEWKYSELESNKLIEYAYKLKGPDKPKVDCCDVRLMPSFISTNTTTDDGWSLNFTVAERGLQWNNVAGVNITQFIHWDIDYIDNGIPVDFWSGERTSFATNNEVSCEDPIGSYGTGLAWVDPEPIGTYPVTVTKGYYMTGTNGALHRITCDSDSGFEELTN